MSAFADITATTTLPLTSAPGDTIALRAELSAQETYELLETLRQPATPARGLAIVRVFLDHWSLTNRDGSPCPVSDAALGMLKVGVRREVDALVDAHMATYLAHVFPEEIQTDAVEGEATADAAGETASSASA